MSPDGGQAPGPARARLRRVFGIDPRALACLRIGLAALLLLNLLLRAPVFSALYGDLGVFPRALVGQVNPGWSAPYFVYTASGSAIWLLAAALLSALFALGLLVGFHTRLCTAASWFLLACLHVRNPLATSYEDQVMVLLLFWGLFLPLGARASLDARHARHPAPRAPEGPVVSGGSAALLVQFASIYFFSALMKTGAPWHGESNAIVYALSQHYWATPAAEALLPLRSVLDWMTPVAWIWELSLPLLLFSPWANAALRTLAVASIWAFHGTLWLCFALGLFPLAMMLGAVVFLPPAFWDRLSAAWARGRGRPPRAPAAARGAPRRLSLGADLLPAALALLVLLVNVDGLWRHHVLPRAVLGLAASLRLEQGWRMYAPAPTDVDHFYALPGRLADGRLVDLAHGGAPFSEDPPARTPWRLAPRPWALHMDHVRLLRQHGYALPFAAWLCHDWNARHTGPERLVAFEWRMERFFLDGRGGENGRHRALVGRWRCSEAAYEPTHATSDPP